MGFSNSYVNCYNAALQCETKTEFTKSFGAACLSARKHGWINNFTWFKKRTAHNKKWNYDTVLEEARKYTTRKEFSDKAHGAYKVALQNGWIELCDWFEDTHAVLSRALKAARPSKWTYEICKQIASESKGRQDFRRKSGGAYNASWKNKWLDDFFPIN